MSDLSVPILHTQRSPLALPPPSYGNDSQGPMAIQEILMKMGAMNGKFFSLMNGYMETVTDSLQSLSMGGEGGGEGKGGNPLAEEEEGEEGQKKQSKLTMTILEKFDDIADAMKSTTKNIAESIFDTVVGPFQLITKPLEQMGGFKFFDLLPGFGSKNKSGESPSDKLYEFFTGRGKNDKKRITPNRNQILQKTPMGEGFVYIGDILEGKKTKDKTKKGGLLQSLFGGASGESGIIGIASKVFPMLLKALPLVALAAGIIWGVIDAIKAVGMADKWGVSKVAAGIGGFLGGTGKGWSNAFANAGKWALIGAGAGFLIGGPVGAIAGGLIGAAIGGLLGYIGGEAIAKYINGTFSSIGAFLGGTGSGWKNAFANAGKWALIGAGVGFVVGGPIGALAGGFIGAAIGLLLGYIGGQKINTFFAGVGKFFVDAGHAIANATVTLFKGAVSIFNKIFVDKHNPVTGKIQKSLIHKAGDAIVGLGKNIFGFIGGVGKAASTGGILGAAKYIGDAILPIFQNISKGVTSFIDAHPVLKGIVDSLMGPISWIENVFKSAVAEIKKFAQDPVKYIKELFTTVKDAITGFFSSLMSFFNFLGSQSIFETAKQVFSGSFGKNLQDYTTRNKELTTLIDQKGTTAFQQTLVGTKFSGESQSQAVGDLTKGENTKLFKSIVSNLQTMPDVTKVQDAIIRPDGKVIMTSPDDTIYATKNSMNTEAINPSITKGNSELIQSVNKLIAVFEVASKNDKKGGNTIVQNSFVSRYHPTNIMKSTGVEVI